MLGKSITLTYNVLGMGFYLLGWVFSLPARFFIRAHVDAEQMSMYFSLLGLRRYVKDNPDSDVAKAIIKNRAVRNAIKKSMVEGATADLSAADTYDPECDCDYCRTVRELGCDKCEAWLASRTKEGDSEDGD